MIILLHSDGDSLRPFPHRAASFDFASIPVPVDVIAYIPEEWAHLETVSPRFYQTLTQELIWVWRETSN